MSYEEQVTTVREHLASLLEKEEDWSKAAQTLAGIDLDSGMLLVCTFHVGLVSCCHGQYSVAKTPFLSWQSVFGGWLLVT